MNFFYYRLFAFILLCSMALSNAAGQCTSDAGTMNPTLIEACTAWPATAAHDGDEVLDANDVLQFALHTSNGNTLGTVLALNTGPVFDFDAGTMGYGITYYISAVVGNDDGGGNVDQGDPCLSVAVGTPVVFLEPPTALLTGSAIICEGEVTFLTLSLTGQGPWVLEWQADGAPQSPALVVSSTPFAIPVELAGTYTLLSVTDVNGCPGTVSGSAVVEVSSILLACPTVTNGCVGQPVFMNCTISGQGPFNYQWTPPGPVSDPTILNPIIFQPGTYLLEATDANGCTGQTIVVISLPPPITTSIAGNDTLSCLNNNQTAVSVNVTGGIPPFTIQWSNSASGQTAIITAAGTYVVTITDASGCSAINSVEIVSIGLECGSIQGTLAFDEDENCFPNPGEPGLEGWMVRALGDETFYGLTAADGSYNFPVLPGDYVVDVILPNLNYWEACQSGLNVSIDGPNDIDTADFQVNALVDCPYLEVDISTPFLRRCFSNTFAVNYCNLGTAVAGDAFIEISLDPQIEVTGASIPFSGPIDGIYTFDLGNVGVGECGSFSIQAFVSCSTVLGQALCAEAHIFPDSLCAPTNPLWTGASIQITSECTADSIIFTIQNVGLGGMTESSSFIVVEDGVMFMNGPQDFQLQAGESLSLSFPANGSTWVLIAGQVDGHPGNSSPLLAVEGCGVNNQGIFSTGFLTQFPENDADPFISIDCHEVIGSFDPNDKYGFPKGYGDEHLIEPGQALDYVIRFQNTGTDTAFKVVIADVIAAELDLATLRPGAASHPYQMEIHGDTLLFIFENILLPDSNVNESGSHGFVKFRIGQKAGLPLETVIENSAAIYFDFNDPVITNTTVHKLAEHFITTATSQIFSPKINWTVSPNPFSNEATFLIKGADFREVEVSLYDLTGRFALTNQAEAGVVHVQKGGLAPGLYFYTIRVNGVMAGQGKLVLE